MPGIEKGAQMANRRDELVDEARQMIAGKARALPTLMHLIALVQALDDAEQSAMRKVLEVNGNCLTPYGRKLLEEKFSGV
jgi:hypothetical protein